MHLLNLAENVFLRQTTSVIPYSILLQIRQIWPWRYGEELKDFFVFCQDLLNINAPEQYCASIEPGRKCLFAPNHISHPIQYITSNSANLTLTVWWRVEGFFCFLPRFIKYKRSRTILCIYWTWQKISPGPPGGLRCPQLSEFDLYACRRAQACGWTIRSTAVL